MDLERQHIVDELDHRIAVQLDIRTFEKIEETLQNFALFSLMRDSEEDMELSLDEAKSYYAELEKRHH